MCGTSCPEGITCLGGECRLDCDDGLAFCPEARACIDLQTTTAHCGGCGEACPVAEGIECRDGACACADVQEAFCGEACTDLSSDLAHCGACEAACGPYEVCAGGACTCPAGMTECGADCSDLMTDTRYCGACETECRLGERC